VVIGTSYKIVTFEPEITYADKLRFDINQKVMQQLMHTVINHRDRGDPNTGTKFRDVIKFRTGLQKCVDGGLTEMGEQLYCDELFEVVPFAAMDLTLSLPLILDRIGLLELTNTHKLTVSR